MRRPEGIRPGRISGSPGWPIYIYIYIYIHINRLI